MRIKSNFLVKPALLAAVCYLGSTMAGPTYNNVDNVTVALVTNGYFGPSVFCQYLHPLFCVLIYGLSHLIPSADMFTVLVHLLIFLELFFLSWLGFDRLKDRHKTGIEYWIPAASVVLCVVYLSFCLRLWNANYTIQTASFVFAGMIGIFRGKKKAAVYAGTLFISLGFLMRNVAGLLFIPYFLLEALTSILEAAEGKHNSLPVNKYNSAASVFKRIMPCVILSAILFVSQTVFYAIEPHAEDKCYSEARTVIVDFPMKNWNSVKEIFADDPMIDEAEYEAVQNWILADTEIMDTENLQAIAKAGASNRYPYSVQGIIAAVNAMWKRVVGADVQLFMLVILLLVLMGRVLFSTTSRIRKGEAILAAAGTFLILLYYSIRGRALTHVWFCVLIAAGSILAPAAFSIPETVQDNRKSRLLMGELGSLLICFLLYFSIGQELRQTDFHLPRTALTARTANSEAEYQGTFEDDAIYVWPNWQSELKSVFRENDKLPSEEFLEHNIAMGDWTYGQIYYREYLSRLGVDNPATAGLNGQKVYYMNIKDGAFLKYMKSHYGEDIEAVEAATVNGSKAYRLERRKQDADKQHTTQD